MNNRDATELIDRHKPSLLLSGTSGQQEEVALVHACNIRGIPTVSVVDLSVRQKFDDREEDSVPKFFFVTNQGCATELAMMGVVPERVVLAGSTHLEQVAHGAAHRNPEAVADSYGIERGTPLVSFFCGPNTTDSVNAVISLATLLLSALIESARLIVRPHPRMPDVPILRDACSQFDYLIFDDQETISTPSLLSESQFSFSMASAVSLESVVLGIPTAFYQIDWDYKYHDDQYPHQGYVPRIRSAADLIEFVEHALKFRLSSGDRQVENYSGALDRSWKAVRDIVPIL